MKIGFIGLGNMATAIMGGLLAKDMVAAGDVIGYDKWPAAGEKLQQKY